MEEHRIHCPRCRHGNPPENRFCGACGASLTSTGELIGRPEGSPCRKDRTLLPAGLKPAGRALAVGLAALAAEAGLAWLRHRAGGTGRTPSPPARGTEPASSEHPAFRIYEEVRVWSREGDSEGWLFAQRAMESFRATPPIDRQR